MGDAELAEARDAQQPLEKPPYSYVALIAMAIQSSPEQRLPLRDIYAYIAGRFPYYRCGPKGWQNCVRHNLSLNPCFLRLPRRSASSAAFPRRGGDWAIHPAFQDMFPGGDYTRRRRSRRALPPPPAPPPPPPASPWALPACSALSVPCGCGCPEMGPAWAPPPFLGPPAWPPPRPELRDPAGSAAPLAFA